MLLESSVLCKCGAFTGDVVLKAPKIIETTGQLLFHPKMQRQNRVLDRGRLWGVPIKPQPHSNQNTHYGFLGRRRTEGGDIVPCFASTVQQRDNSFSFFKKIRFGTDSAATHQRNKLK